MSAPYALAVDRAWLDPDPSDAAAALADELRDIAQRVVTDPRLIDEATGERKVNLLRIVNLDARGAHGRCLRRSRGR